MQSISLFTAIVALGIASPIFAQSVEPHAAPAVAPASKPDQAPKPRTVRIAGRTVDVASLEAAEGAQRPVNIASLDAASSRR